LRQETNHDFSSGMRHSEFPSQVCSVARSLEIVGEWWTLLVVREAFFGTERFSDFEANLGIAKNVLTDRLNTLVDAGVMRRTPVPGRGNPVRYSLTDQGRDLLPVLVALMQWGDRWVNGGKAPVRVLERTSGKEVALVRVTNSGGAKLGARDVVIVPGPGADAALKNRFGRRTA
jgi:DNA-binding HxlR family transcriptional regulator